MRGIQKYCVFVFLFYFGTGFICPGLRAQSNIAYQVKNFTKQEYNAESQNWSITHDQLGITYAANNIGLLEFDGIEWTFHPAPNGTIIRSVAVDSSNRIFTSGYREIGYWERDEFGLLAYHSLNYLAESLYSQNEEFWNIKVTRDKVYFHSFTSVFIYDYKEFTFVRPGPLISSLGAVDGKVYLHISGEGIYFLEDSLLIPLIQDEVLRENMVQFITSYGEDTLLIGTVENGLFLYNNGRVSPFLPEWKEYFKRSKVNRGMVSEQGSILIGTLLDGISIFSKEGWRQHVINRSKGLQNSTVLGLDIDRNDNIWVALDQGIDFVSMNVDPSFSIQVSEEVGAVYSAAIFEGKIYLCTNLGVFYRSLANETLPFQLVENTEGQAWECKVFNEQLLVGHNNGTYRIKGGSAKQIADVNGGMSFIRHPLEKNTIVQSTYTNIVYFSNLHGEYQYKSRLAGFSDLIRFVEYDHLDQLWAGHMRRGIFRIEMDPKTDTIAEINYFGKNVFGRDYDIQLFKVENRIVFTNGEKTFTYDDLIDRIVPYEQMNEGLGEYSTAHRIIGGPDHYYWVISEDGIALFRIFNNQYRFVKEYPAGLFGDHLIKGFENIYPIDEKRALLCLDNGIAMIDANKTDLSGGILDKKLFLTGIKYRGKTGSYENLPLGSKKIRLPFNKNSLQLTLAFPNYSFEEIDFQYLISGLNNEWSEVYEKPEFIFDRIPPGDYEIFIRATNKWNKSCQAERIVLEVLRPWYLSSISFVIYGAILLVGALVTRYFLLLRISVRERNIRNAKEKELIRLRNEKLNAELSYRSQELANSTMSIIRKNEFLLKLKGIVKKQKEELGTRYPDKYFREIVERIDRNVASMDDWKVFEFHFEKAHEKFLHKLMNKYPQLTHGDLRLCAYLRMNLTSKEIAPLLRISVRGVENHRYKLRKKLNLQPEENLTDFILGI